MKLLDTVRLSDNQKRVIAKILAAPTPKLAAEEISDGANMIKARDILMDLGLITFTLNDQAELTDKGQQVAQAENLADESGQLTPDGEKFAYTNEFNAGDSDMSKPEGGDMGQPEVPPAPDAGMDQPLNMSAVPSGNLLRELFNHANFNIRR